MTRDRWHILREGDTLTMARRLPVRFDFAVETTLPAGGRLRIARQVRQDMWRCLQGVRGFSPVVRVRAEGETCHVTAGGAVDGVFPRARLEATLRNMLEDNERRARWSAHSAHREVCNG